jgi:hypothetical protein
MTAVSTATWFACRSPSLGWSERSAAVCSCVECGARRDGSRAIRASPRRAPDRKPVIAGTRPGKQNPSEADGLAVSNTRKPTTTRRISPEGDSCSMPAGLAHVAEPAAPPIAWRFFVMSSIRRWTGGSRARLPRRWASAESACAEPGLIHDVALRCGGSLALTQAARSTRAGRVHAGPLRRTLPRVAGTRRAPMPAVVTGFLH